MEWDWCLPSPKALYGILHKWATGERKGLYQYNWMSSWDLLLPGAAYQPRTQDSFFFGTKSWLDLFVCLFYKEEIMKGNRSLRPIQAQGTKEKSGVGKKSQKRRCLLGSPWGRRWWIPSMERLQQKPRKLRAGQNWPWWARKDDLVHHCGGRCSLGKFFSHFSQQVSAAPAIPCLSRSMKACER